MTSPARLSSRREQALAILRCVALALLAGHLLFAHGCHGDEDHELFTRLAVAEIATP
jgi:hypothetical protein